MRIFTSRENCPFPLRALVHEFAGGDLFVLVEGGVGHLGALTLSLPRESQGAPGETRASTSVLTAPGHRDDEAAREMSDILVRALGRKVGMVVGMHFPGLKPAELDLVRAEWRFLAREIATAWPVEDNDGSRGN